MSFKTINTTTFATTLSALLQEKLGLHSRPETSLLSSIGTLTVTSDNLALHQSFSMFREFHAVGKGYLTNPESNFMGTVASLDILITGTLHDGQETARHFASLDLLPNGNIAFIRFGDESSGFEKAA